MAQAKGGVIEAPDKGPKTIELIYFPVQARAENLKMMLAYGKMNYIDTFIYGQNWRDDKKAGKFPFGSLPVVVVTKQDGSKITLAQSGSITRYLAKYCGAYPADPLEAAMCDSVFEHGQDMSRINPIVNIFSGEKFKQLSEEWFSSFEEKLGKLLPYLGKGPFFFERSTPLYCDFMIYHILDNARRVRKECLDGKESVLAFMKAVEALPSTSEYLKSRPTPINIGEKPMLDPVPKCNEPKEIKFN
eukprot:CAMPEP_0184479744 /NCGR_PEP_ID=MMETSP0113_2-20130426/1347_1 /TAXON_ID=91329 /ORGANISM="Norrisiella sphaerica, Strain BC52" /LENGTH=244 /DNA_ID=CAMNT_0026857885 /DNA_START=49 /DNA_END=783 /DNA_ORIENTATION=+